MTSISETADRAADIIETQGHLKHDWGENGSPRCLGGAISQACDEMGTNIAVDRAYILITDAVNYMIGWCSHSTDFVDWNNAPERTPEEVIQVLRDVATKHRSDAMTVTGGE